MLHDLKTPAMRLTGFRESPRDAAAICSSAASGDRLWRSPTIGALAVARRARPRRCAATAVRSRPGATAGAGSRCDAGSAQGASCTSASAPRASATSPSRSRPTAAARADRRADYHDPTLPPRHALVAFGLWLRQGARLPRAGPCRRARHAGMAAGQDGGAERELLSRDRRRRAAGRLSVHRQQSRRGGAGQAAHRRGDHRPPDAAADGAGLDESQQRAGAAGRRICAGRRARPPPPRPAGEADRRDRARRPGSPARPASAATDDARRRRCAGSTPGSATSRISRSRTACTSMAARADDEADPLRRASAEAERAALLAALDGRHVERRARPARRRAAAPTCCRPAAICSPPIRAPCRRRPPSSSARAAADEVLRRYAAGSWRLAARAGDRSLGQRQPAHRRRGDRAGAGADGLPAAMGRRDRPRHRHRGAAAGGARPAARRRDLAHLRPVPRHVPDPDRADRRRGRRGRRARRGRWRTTRSPQRRAPTASRRAHLRLVARHLWRRPRGPAGDAATGTTREELGRAYLDAASHAYRRRRRRRRRGAGRLRRARRRGRPAGPHRRRSRPRHPRRLGRRRLHRRLRGRARGARRQAPTSIVLDTTDPARPRPRSLARGGRPASCAPAPSIRASSRARCGTARAAPPNSPRRSTGWSASPRPPTPFPAR